MPLEDHKGEAAKSFINARQRDSMIEPTRPPAKAETAPDTDKPPAHTLKMEPPGMARVNVSSLVGGHQPVKPDPVTPELREEFIKRMEQRGQNLHEMDRQSIKGRLDFNGASRSRDGRDRG